MQWENLESKNRGVEGKGRGLSSWIQMVPSPNSITGPDLESLGSELQLVVL